MPRKAAAASTTDASLVGQPAPDFTANDDTGKAVKLADFRGKKLIVFFYPKDNTPG